MLRDLVRSLSLANLCFFAVWAELQKASAPRVAYYHRVPPGPEHYSAVASNVFLLAGAVWVALTAARRSRRPAALWLARSAFLLVLVVPLNAVRTEVMTHLPASSIAPAETALLASASILSVGLLIYFATGFHRFSLAVARTTSAAALVLTVLSPFVLVTMGHVVGALARGGDRDRVPLPPLAGATGDRPRVLWLVFDELDQLTTFEDRPVGLMLPEFDRLRGRSLYADAAVSPAGDTLRSLPSLITGRTVEVATPADPGELTIRFRGARRAVPWSSQPSVFTRARRAGVDAALVGWYHPYARVLGDTMTSCIWEPCYHNSDHILMDYDRERSVAWHQVDSLVSALPWGKRRRTQDLIRTWKRVRVDSFLRLRDQTVARALDRRLGLVVAHFPVPHSPGIWDRARSDFSWGESTGYLDNLALVDHTLGALRRSLERAGVWDGMAVVVSSDHRWRSRPGGDGVRDYRVPFLLKMPQQTEGSAFHHEFNTVVTQGLILSILDGTVTTPAGAAKWIDRNRNGDDRKPDAL